MKVVNRPIEVIASFTRQGTIQPVRFRMIDNDDHIQVVPIKRVVQFSEERKGCDQYITFHCQSFVNEIFKDFELRFYKQGLQWILFKI